MATTIHIYLPIQADGVTPDTEFIRALSIPLEDIVRLTFRPLKWLRFATFAVCGAKGHLSATRAGESVDYENITLENIANEYYYKPDGMYHIVDLKACNARMTASVATTRRSEFRRDICDRDQTCVITGRRSNSCNATHILPCVKGDDYITRVVQDRFGLYEQLPFGPPGDSVGINYVQNGLLLNKLLHLDFRHSQIVFLRTPNFAMAPTDVPQVEEGPAPPSRTTLQYLIPCTGRCIIPPLDVQVDWPDELAPPSILLDFMYGAAVVKHWKCDDLHIMLDQRHKDYFSDIPKYPKFYGSEIGEDDDTSRYSEQSDEDWSSGSERRPRGRYKPRKRFSDEAKAAMSEAMDTVLLLSRLVRGPTPQWVIEEREKRVKEKELRSQEESVEKVQQWLGSSHVP